MNLEPITRADLDALEERIVSRIIGRVLEALGARATVARVKAKSEPDAAPSETDRATARRIAGRMGFLVRPARPAR